MKKGKFTIKAAAVALIGLVTVIPMFSFAEDEAVKIEGINELSQEIAEQSIYVYESFNIPGSITATVEGEEVEIVLSGWEELSSGEVTKTGKISHEGTYTYRAVISKEYEGVYDFSESELPIITVKVTKKETSVTGKNMSIEKKARGTIKDTVTVENGNGRYLRLQMYNTSKKKWVTKAKVKTSKDEVQSIALEYTDDWWYKTNTKWRMYIKESEGYEEYKSDTIKVKAKRYYQMPSSYFQLSDSVSIKGGGYTLYKGYMGLKVKKINYYFGIGDKNWPRYTASTKAKVKAFQKKHGLKATGNCNKATWLKIGEILKKKNGKTGFTKKSWYHLGAYVHKVEITPASTRKECIETFISTAYEYLGDPYVVGASGKPGQGCDCSGLVMQACYSCGIDLSPTSVVRHAKPAYEYESRKLYKSKKLKKVSFSKRKRGDLIFYRDSDGVIDHVAIYLGDNKIIHSWPNKVQISSVYGWGNIDSKVGRIFS